MFPLEKSLVITILSKWIDRETLRIIRHDEAFLSPDCRVSGVESRAICADYNVSREGRARRVSELGCERATAARGSGIADFNVNATKLSIVSPRLFQRRRRPRVNTMMADGVGAA